MIQFIQRTISRFSAAQFLKKSTPIYMTSNEILGLNVQRVYPSLNKRSLAQLLTSIYAQLFKFAKHRDLVIQFKHRIINRRKLAQSVM